MRCHELSLLRFSDHLSFQQFSGKVCDDIPGVVNVGILGVLCAHTEADHVATMHGRRHHVQFSRCIDVGKKLLVKIVVTLKTEAHQTHLKNTNTNVLN